MLVSCFRLFCYLNRNASYTHDAQITATYLHEDIYSSACELDSCYSVNEIQEMLSKKYETCRSQNSHEFSSTFPQPPKKWLRKSKINHFSTHFSDITTIPETVAQNTCITLDSSTRCSSHLTQHNNIIVSSGTATKDTRIV